MFCNKSCIVMHVFNLYMIHGHYFFKLCTGTYSDKVIKLIITSVMDNTCCIH